MERKSLKALIATTPLAFNEPDRSNLDHENAVFHGMLLLVDIRGDVVAMVGVADLFDKDGNRFADDRD